MTNNLPITQRQAARPTSRNRESTGLRQTNPIRHLLESTSSSLSSSSSINPSLMLPVRLLGGEGVLASHLNPNNTASLREQQVLTLSLVIKNGWHMPSTAAGGSRGSGRKKQERTQARGHKRRELLWREREMDKRRRKEKRWERETEEA